MYKNNKTDHILLCTFESILLLRNIFLVVKQTPSHQACLPKKWKINKRKSREGVLIRTTQGKGQIFGFFRKKNRRAGTVIQDRSLHYLPTIAKTFFVLSELCPADSTLFIIGRSFSILLSRKPFQLLI